MSATTTDARAPTKANRKKAPGPRGHIVMGNLKAYIDDPVMMLMQLRDEYGDIARNRLGPFMTHALAHPDHIEYVLQTNHRNYCRGKFYDNFKLIFGDGLLTTDGEFWRQHRRVMQPAFHKTHIEAGMSIAGRQAEALADRWRALPAGEPTDVIPEMMRLSLGALGEMMFKTDISQYHEEVGPHVHYAIRCMMPQGDHNDFIPRWAPTPFNIRTKRARRGIDKVIDKVIDDHRAAFSEHDAVDDSDIISLLLSARDPQTKAFLPKQEIHDEVATVFLAGHETTGSGLGWLLYALAQNPHAMRRLREELDDVLGGRAPEADDLARLPYLEAVVNETLRLYPPIWTYTRDLIADDEIAGYHIPAGSSVFLSPYVAHRHPDFWSNPEAFDPENFTSGAPARHKYAFFPFGGGMRKCIGFQVAVAMMRALAAIAVQHFDFSLKPGHEIKRGALISLRPANGLPLVIRARAVGRGHPSPPGNAPPENQRSNTPEAPKSAPGGGLSGCPFMGAPVEGAPSASAPADEAKVLEPGAPFEPKTLLPAIEGLTQRIAMIPQERPLRQDEPFARLVGKKIMIVNGAELACERMSLHLARSFARASVFNPAGDLNEAALEAAARALDAQVGGFDAIVDLGATGLGSETGDSEKRDSGARDWELPMRRTLAALKAVYGAWALETRADRIVYLAVTAMDGLSGYGGGGEGNPLGGLWAGLAKTLPQEMPNCNVRALDLAPNEIDRLPERVIAELWRDRLIEVGYRDGRRTTLQPVAAPLPERPPIIDAGPGDAILFSGGARGIGFLCAEAIGRATGAEIILTGREPPPSGDEPWAMLDDEEFKAWARAQLTRGGPSETVAAIRRRTDGLDRRRALKRNLDTLAASGVNARYCVCDVADRAAVAALCQELGDRLVMIVHNAGVDRPVRLPGKSADDFIAVIKVKVEGYRNLLEASKGNARLKRVIAFGSLTGRWGGMTGETDYAAGNDALSRMTLHEMAHRPGVVFRCLVWPTWEQVGMITNFDVTKRYISPLPVKEAVRFFLAETGEPQSGDAVFMGAIGDAVTPVQIHGYTPLPGLSGSEAFAARRHHVGRPSHFRPYGWMVTDYDIDPAHLDLRPFRRRNKEGALLAALILEHGLQAAHWARPEDGGRMSLMRAEEITLDFGACVRTGLSRSVRLRTSVNGLRSGLDWRVDVIVTERASGQEWLRCAAIFSDLDREAAIPKGEKSVAVETLRAQDVWIDPSPPAFLTPLAHVMAALETLAPNIARAGQIISPGVEFGPGAAEESSAELTFHPNLDPDLALVHDDAERLVMALIFPTAPRGGAEKIAENSHWRGM